VKLERALDEEDPSLSDDERLRTIASAVKTRGLPFLKSCASLKAIKRLPSNTLDEVANLRVRKLIKK